MELLKFEMKKAKVIIVAVLALSAGCWSCATEAGLTGRRLPVEGTAVYFFPEWEHMAMSDSTVSASSAKSRSGKDVMVWDPGEIRSKMPVLVPNEVKNFYHLKIYEPKNNDGWYSPDYRGEFYRQHEEPRDTLQQVF